jgi:hypothetical protein
MSCARAEMSERLPHARVRKSKKLRSFRAGVETIRRVPRRGDAGDAHG